MFGVACLFIRSRPENRVLLGCAWLPAGRDKQLSRLSIPSTSLEDASTKDAELVEAQP